MKNMELFLVWSGPRSEKVAEHFKKFLPQIMDSISPIISGDIGKGNVWHADLAQKLQSAQMGIICLTRENLNSTWIHFESGVLFRRMDEGPYIFLLDVKQTDVKQPLGAFQNTSFEKQDVKKLLQDICKRIRESGEEGPDNESFNDRYEKFWPEFEKNLQEIVENESDVSEPTRSEGDILREILQIVRIIGSQSNKIADKFPLTRRIETEVPFIVDFQENLIVFRSLNNLRQVELDFERNDDLKEFKVMRMYVLGEMSEEMRVGFYDYAAMLMQGRFADYRNISPSYLEWKMEVEIAQWRKESQRGGS
jgi:hypothetical protein